MMNANAVHDALNAWTMQNSPAAVVVALALLLILAGGARGQEGEAPPAGAPDTVNVRDFAGPAQDGDWSAAIQAAIDHISAENGYVKGATVYFPPGTYRIDRTIRVGDQTAHHGIHLRGYGAVLVGTEALDSQPLRYEERLEAAREAGDSYTVNSLPGELDFDGETNVGVPILELWNQPRNGLPYMLYEGASYVIEGLTFDRETRQTGVGIKIPAETVPKNITFRDVKVHNQNVGIHINHCYQIRFESCIIRGNRIGVWGRNHFNSVSVLNSEFRRGHHGLIIGPNHGTWGSSGIYVAGSIFEDLSGWGILNAGGNQFVITGNYFEANANNVGVLTPFGNTTIDTNHFWGVSGGADWKENNVVNDQVVSRKAHVVLRTPNVHLRGNNYSAGGIPILVFSIGDRSSFDAQPTAAEGADLPDGLTVLASNAPGAYVHDALARQFTFRRFALATEDEAGEDPAARLQREITLAERQLAEAETTDARVHAQAAIGHAWLAAGDFDRARQEYEKAFQYPARDQLHLRAAIQIYVADSYMQQGDYVAAEAAYARAMEIGPGGWRRDHVEKRLAEVRELLRQRKYICTVCAHVYDPAQGDEARGVAPGTPFADLPDDWVCPAGGEAKDRFIPVDNTPAAAEE